MLRWLHDRFKTLSRSVLISSIRAVAPAMHSGCLEAWKSSPPSNVVFLRLAFSCFPGGQVAKLFQDSSLGNAVNIVVTRLILLMEDQVKSTKLSSLLFNSAVTKTFRFLPFLWNQSSAATKSLKSCMKAGKRKGGCINDELQQVKF